MKTFIPLLLAVFLLTACKNPKFQEIVLQAATGSKRIDLSAIRVIAVAPASSAPMDIFLADQTRNYLVANSSLKVLSKAATENVVFRESYTNSFSEMTFGTIESQHKLPFSLPDADAVILCQIPSGERRVIVSSSTANLNLGKASSDRIDSMSLRADFRVLDANGETILKATGSATATGQFNGFVMVGVYFIPENEAVALILDHGAKTFVKDWILKK